MMKILAKFLYFAVIMKLAWSLGLCQDGEVLEKCVCEMADKSGTIDLRSIGNSTNEPWYWEIPSSNDPPLFFYSYNPCYEFTDCNFRIHGLAMSQEPGDSADPCLDIGTMNSSRFVQDENGNVSIHYHSYDFKRTAVVHLECDQSSIKTLLIQYGNDYYKNNFTFRLRGPDACLIKAPHDGAKTLFVITAVIVTLVIIGGISFKIYRSRSSRLCRSTENTENLVGGSIKSNRFRWRPRRGELLDDVNTEFANSQSSYGSVEEEYHDVPGSFT